jgi:hypothetical protein
MLVKYRKHLIVGLGFVSVLIIIIVISLFAVTGERRKRIKAEELALQLKTDSPVNFDKPIAKTDETISANSNK